MRKSTHKHVLQYYMFFVFFLLYFMSYRSKFCHKLLILFSLHGLKARNTRLFYCYGCTGPPVTREYCVLNRRWVDKNAYDGAVGLCNMGHLSVSGRIFKELVFHKLLIMFLNLIFFCFSRFKN